MGPQTFLKPFFSPLSVPIERLELFDQRMEALTFMTSTSWLDRSSGLMPALFFSSSSSFSLPPVCVSQFFSQPFKVVEEEEKGALKLE